MATEADWAAYRTAVVDVEPPGGDRFRIVAAPPGTTGEWPDGLDPPVVVLTAWDPGSVRQEESVNRARHDELVAALAALTVSWWPATGRDPDGDHLEEGAAVTGLTVTDALAMGRRFGQAAVYVWTPVAWQVHSCTEDRTETFGWVRRPVAPGPAPTGGT
jgi:hypothetical protein